MYDDFIERGDRVYFFDTDRRMLVDEQNTMAPIPAAEVPWFSTRYPVKLVLQPITEGAPSAIAQTPCNVKLYRGSSVFGNVTAVGSWKIVCVIPRMDVTPGAIDVDMTDGLGNTVLAFRTVVVDAIPERPGRIPLIYSNPNSERTNDNGERVIRQPSDRVIRLQRDPSAFIISIPEGTAGWNIALDFCSLPLGIYNACNRLVVHCSSALEITSDDASLSTSSLSAGWHEARVSVMPDGNSIITFEEP